MVDAPEHTVVVALSGRCACGRGLETLEVEELPERRQVAEPVVRREVTEYRTVAGVCSGGRVRRSAFPAGVEAPVQYGPGVSAFAVHLTQYQQLPYRRTADLLHALAGIAPSPATVYAMGREAAACLAAPVAAIGQALVMAETYPGRPWPGQLIALLDEANEATYMARAAGFAALPGPTIKDFFNRCGSGKRTSRTHVRALIAAQRIEPDVLG